MSFRWPDPEVEQDFLPQSLRSGAGRPIPGPDLRAYQGAVAQLLPELKAHTGEDQAGRFEKVLGERMAEPELAAVLSTTPGGVDESVQRLLAEVRTFQPNPRSSALDLTALIRIFLYFQIEVMWWGQTPAYRTDAEVRGAGDLVDLEKLHRSGLLRFQYLRQADNLAIRAARAARRRLSPDATPRTAGLRFALARPELVALLNQLGDEFSRFAPPRTPRLWVNSLARSEEQQHQLRGLGYTAMLPSSHCVGYGVDLEISWLRRFDAHRALEMLLLERQNTGDINVIDEGQAWHVGVSPTATAELRAAFDKQIASQGADIGS